MRFVIWLRIYQLIAGFILSAGLFVGGFKLLIMGIKAKGAFTLKTALLSGEITAESAGLAMIFAGVIVFVASLLSKANISRGRMNLGFCSELAVIDSIKAYKRFCPI